MSIPSTVDAATIADDSLGGNSGNTNSHATNAKLFRFWTEEMDAPSIQHWKGRALSLQASRFQAGSTAPPPPLSRFVMETMPTSVRERMEMCPTLNALTAHREGIRARGQVAQLDVQAAFASHRAALDVEYATEEGSVSEVSRHAPVRGNLPSEQAGDAEVENLMAEISSEVSDLGDFAVTAVDDTSREQERSTGSPPATSSSDAWMRTMLIDSKPGPSK